jgi:hypothetical protein
MFFLKGMSDKWPSFNNIHRVLFEKNKYNIAKGCADPIDELFDHNVNFSIKIDGSNLGIHVKRDDSNHWYIKKLRGRNSAIWTDDSSVSIIRLPKYGKWALQLLPKYMFEFAKSIGDALNANDIIIYGEFFLAGNFPSWHPFGMSVDGKINFLTRKLHDLFSKHQILDNSHGKPPEMKDNTSMLGYLKTVDTYVVFPPPLLFSGNLTEGIGFFHETMLHASIDFEGLFIIDETVPAGYKWKTGFHEEQPIISNVEELDFKTEKAKATYIKLVLIFATRPIKEERISLARSTEKKKNEDVTTQNQVLLRTMTDTAIQREISKMTSFEHTPHKERFIITDKLTLLVITEIKKQLSDSAAQIPWSDEVLNHDVRHLVNTYVMKVKFVRCDD